MGANHRERKETVKKSFYLKPDLYEFMKNNLEMANAASETEFVNMALNFFIGYLKTDDAEMYLLRTFSSVLHSSLDLSESRINDQLYKMSVELSMLNRIVGYGKRLTEKDIGTIRAISEKEIKEIR